MTAFVVVAKAGRRYFARRGETVLPLRRPFSGNRRQDMPMRSIEELEDLDPAGLVQADEAIDEAALAHQHIDTQARIEGAKAARGDQVRRKAFRRARRRRRRSPVPSRA